MADFITGTKTGTRGGGRYGQQNRKDRLGGPNPSPTIHASHGLKE